MSQPAASKRYNDKELEEFKILIEDKMARAKEELAYYRQQLNNRSDNADARIRGLDDSNNTVEVERLTNMAVRQQKLIKHLENALFRIQNKVYGICRETGELISKERLRAVPHATLSIKAKQSR